MNLFELQGDEGDEERVKMNCIIASAQEGTLKRTKDKEGNIRFQGMFLVRKGHKLDKKDNKSSYYTF